ncbi:MAG TPA: MBL fold metallo-hydrolase [Bdellovibrionota bacterium]|jgi:glyoxylase-like metal-dependent hydrolase (beta-lactamase superfamily II)|nr:MBL fold metallo-hydrolase [Bdellovibrionota bacterium]
MKSATLLSAIDGNGQRLDGGAMFGNAPQAVWRKWAPPDDFNRIRLACRGMLIEHDGKRILCETGIGDFFEPKLAERFGVEPTDRNLILENLAVLGLKQEDIDLVILSHLHFDHAGGLMPSYSQLQAGNGGLLFPKARYLVGREAWDRAASPHSRDRASFIPELNKRLEASGRLTVVEGDRVPGLFDGHLGFRYSNGHTPGQMHTVFRGNGGGTVVFAGDMIPGVPWVHVPITMGYDRFPEMLIDEKISLYAEAVPHRWWVFYTHDPETRASRVEVDAKGAYRAVEPLTQLKRFSF